MCDYHLRRTMIMVDYREILRLLSLKYNYTQIAAATIVPATRCGMSAVSLRRKASAGLSERNWSNQKLYELLYPERLKKAQVYMEPDCPYIHEELAKKVSTLPCFMKSIRLNAPVLDASPISTPSSARSIAISQEIQGNYEDQP